MSDLTKYSTKQTQNSQISYMVMINVAEYLNSLPQNKMDPNLQM